MYEALTIDPSLITVPNERSLHTWVTAPVEVQGRRGLTLNSLQRAMGIDLDDDDEEENEPPPRRRPRRAPRPGRLVRVIDNGPEANAVDPTAPLDVAAGVFGTLDMRGRPQRDPRTNEELMALRERAEFLSTELSRTTRILSDVIEELQSFMMEMDPGSTSRRERLLMMGDRLRRR